MRRFIIFSICCLLILTSIYISTLIIRTAPKAEKKRPPKNAALVETLPLQKMDETVTLHLTGIVIPAAEIVLRARVSGQIVKMDSRFTEGGLLRKGDEILRINPADYELALVDAQSKLEKARFTYKQELGRQAVAKHEWELLERENSTELEKELALRIPHLAAETAALKAAEASLERHRIDLARTRIHAPFNAVVLQRNVNIGSQASPQEALARLAGTDLFWIRVSIPVDRIGWIKTPGSKAAIFSGSGSVRKGEVVRLLSSLEEKGRMARLLIEIDDPLCIRSENYTRKPLLLGEYVRVKIHGRELKKVFNIPRYALREPSSIWIAAEGKLDIRKIEVLWRNPQEVLVRDGLENGELIIISDITAPVAGMAVNAVDEKAAGPKDMQHNRSLSEEE